MVSLQKVAKPVYFTNIAPISPLKQSISTRILSKPQDVLVKSTKYRAWELIVFLLAGLLVVGTYGLAFKEIL
jgi:hypothetical protein